MPDKKRFLLRIDPELYRALHRWADDEFRSVNGQIEALLSAAVRDAGRARGKKRATQRQSKRLRDGDDPVAESSDSGSASD